MTQIGVVDVRGATDELREMEFVEAGYRKFPASHSPLIGGDRPFYQKKIYADNNSDIRYFITVYEYDFREEAELPDQMRKVFYEMHLQMTQKDDTTITFTIGADKPIEWIEAKVEELFVNLNCINYSEKY